MSVYPIPPSPTWDDVDFEVYEDGFTKEECERIIALGESLDAIDSIVGDTNDDQKVSNSIRKSKNSWIELNETSEWIYARLSKIANDMNGMFWRFDLNGFYEDLQYTRYNEDGDFYGWHIDNGMRSGDPPRKLSIVVQLSDPSEYEGGDLEVHATQHSRIAKAQGLVTVFPSYRLHQVTPVTAGVRRSLVVWLCGPAFR